MRRRTGADAATKRLVDTRAAGLCECCGTPLSWWFSRQHRVARGMGGVHGSRARVINSAANLVAVCGSATSPGCHRACEDRNPTLGYLGFWLPQTADPTAVPVRLFLHGWVRLNVDGTFTRLETREAS